MKQVRAESYRTDVGTEIILVSDFVEELGELKSSEELVTKVNEPGISNYIVCWMRLVASAELQKQPDFYINFLPNVASVHDFCRLVSKAVTDITKNANAFLGS